MAINYPNNANNSFTFCFVVLPSQYGFQKAVAKKHVAHEFEPSDSATQRTPSPASTDSTRYTPNLSVGRVPGKDLVLVSEP